MARNSNILMRLSLPPTAALAASYHLLPQSTSNAFSKLGSIEQSKFPEVHQQRVELRNKLGDSLQDTKKTFDGWSKDLQENTDKGFDKIQDLTGFRVGKQI